MDTPANQQLILNTYLADRNYSQAYRYIATQVAGRPDWDQRMVDWLNCAADINGPTDNFNKAWVFEFNRIAAGRPESVETQAWNQGISDELEKNVISDYQKAISSSSSFTMLDIGRGDVINAVLLAKNPLYAWAGGPAGVLLFGFPDAK